MLFRSFNITVVEQLPQDYAGHDLLVGYHLLPDQFDHKITYGSVPCAVRIGHLTSSNMSLFPVQVADRDEWKLLECVLSRVIQARAEKAGRLRADPVLCVAVTTDEDMFDEVVAGFKHGRTLDFSVAQEKPVKSHQLLVIHKTGAGKVAGVARQFYNGRDRYDRRTTAVEFLLEAIQKSSKALSNVAEEFVANRRRDSEVRDSKKYNNKPPAWSQTFVKLVEDFGLFTGLLQFSGVEPKAVTPSGGKAGLSVKGTGQAGVEAQRRFPPYGQGWKNWRGTGKVYTLSRTEGGTLVLTEGTGRGG